MITVFHLDINGDVPQEDCEGYFVIAPMGYMHIDLSEMS